MLLGGLVNFAGVAWTVWANYASRKEQRAHEDRMRERQAEITTGVG